jgi:hypothetical protein
MEVLWMNYPTPSSLHDSRFLGANKRQREVYNRRRSTLRRRWQRMNQAERLAFLADVVRLAAADGVEFSGPLDLFRLIGPEAFCGRLPDLPWPKCLECGKGLMQFDSGLICPDGHGKVIRSVPSRRGP